jgi:porin
MRISSSHAISARALIWFCVGALFNAPSCAHGQEADPASSTSVASPAATTPTRKKTSAQSPLPVLENDASPNETMVPAPRASEAESTSSAEGSIAHWQTTNAIGTALQELKNDGIALNGRYVSNLATNPVGGMKQGSAESQWFELRADVDLEKLLGWTGTRLHVQGADFEGYDLATRDVGNSIGFQQTWRPVPGWRLTQLNIEHDFDHLTVMVGRAALNTYYNASPLNCVFMSHAACLTSYGPVAAINITAFPNSSWAANFRYDYSEEWYAQAGVFDYNSNLNLPGKGGTDFSFFKGTGTLVAFEVGYESTFATDPYPRRFRIGTDINTDPGTSPLYDVNGDPAGLSGLPRAKQTGTRADIYAMADQTVWHPNELSDRNLALFARAFYNAGAPTAIDSFASMGFVKTGTFEGRDRDTFDFLISDTRFSSQEIEYLRELRAAAGGHGTPHRNEIVGEINYGYSPVSGIRLLPNIQYDIHPDPINAPQSKKNIPSALVFGLRIDIWLAPLFTGRR